MSHAEIELKLLLPGAKADRIEAELRQLAVFARRRSTSQWLSNVYYDTPRDPRAETVDDMRRKWHQQFAQPRYRDLFAAVPTYWMVDDHDFRIDDCDNTGDYLPSPEQARLRPFRSRHRCRRAPAPGQA